MSEGGSSTGPDAGAPPGGPGADISQDPAARARLLRDARSIAVVGLSADPARPSHGVARMLADHGYGILPVNPLLTGQHLFGADAVASLDDLAPPVDIVDIFRRSAEAAQVVSDAIRLKDRLAIRAVWLQLGVEAPDACRAAAAAGLSVVTGHCLKIEVLRLGIPRR
jgi:predicted CoA-binding protein